MIQQINLYRLLPKKTGMYLTREVVLLSYGMLVVILFLIFLISLFQRHGLNSEFSKVEEHNNQLKNQLTALVSQYPISNPDDLKLSIKDLQSQLNDKVYLITMLSQNAIYSGLLLSIAKATVQGAWLNEIIFNKLDEKITLKGFTLNRGLIEDFMSALQLQPLFNGLIFGLDEFAETEHPATFVISTKKVQDL